MSNAFRLSSICVVIAVHLFPYCTYAQQSDTNEKSLENPGAGIFKLPDLNLKVFEVGDEDRPRIGWIIELSNEEEQKLLHNFRYCDGTTTRVERTKLRESSRSCSQDKFGGTLKFAGLPVGEEVVAFLGERKVTGKIVSIQESLTGGYVGIFAYDSDVPSDMSSLGFNVVPANDGSLNFSNASLSGYTEADIIGLQKQWLANSNGTLSSSPGLVDFGVGQIVGATSAEKPLSGDFGSHEVGLSFDIRG